MSYQLETQKERPIQQVKRKKRSRARFTILALLFVGTAINYLDRTNMAVAASSIQDDLGLNAATMGLILSAFGWTYAFMQIPGGWFIDRFGPRLIYGLSLILFSCFTLAQGFAKNFGTLFGLRLGLGLSESPAFPANSRVVASWFPQRERALATGVYTAGEYVGLALATPFLFWLLSSFGWHSIFIVTGVIGLLFAIVWFKVYREPTQSKHINEEELKYIEEGGALVKIEKDKQSHKMKWSDIQHLFKYRQFIGMYLGQFSIASTLYFFLTWFPTYLTQEKGMTFLKAGFMGSFPYIAAGIGVLLGGYWSDKMVKRGLSLNIARKTPVIIGLLGSCSIVLANYTESIGLVITIMSIAFFAQGMSNITWTLVSDMAPKELVGLAGGVFNLAANLAAIVTPIVIGVIVSRTASFNGALIFVSAVALVGALSYIFVIGDVKRVEIVDNKK
ncbi:MFS transporter [Priestia filamentosa]|uniref:Glucarate transporter n=1 Tax=Priestia filamentosa TaxID=1402861 RepID=A0A1X7DNP5_9BACI|nr:MFS transporter [Priestia filamentosa]AKO93264.1 glucarate transporter [Priestia filamentosa]MDT3763418.1 MFS transporter [Priestia filamentosa]OXS72088.1 MFS transporter [Priestia filamentosa]RJS63442.1 MFS transporter [Priestia filamentosa]WRU93861.1 MFS transporter [Priestia filamentosa]